MAEHLEPYSGKAGVSANMSVWQHTAEMAAFVPEHPRLEGAVDADIAIIGAGITGMTTAVLLQQTGLDVAVVDAHAVGYGVSGFNSGHLTNMLLDMRYSTIIDHFGEEATRTIAAGISEAIDLIERLARDYRIDCDFKRLSGYLYAEDESGRKALHREFEAAAKAGLAVNRTLNVPLPFEVAEGIEVPNQARFHPLRYVQGLARQFVRAGGRIFEHSRIIDVNQKSENRTFQVQGETGLIEADEVVVATHTPIGFRPALQTRLEPYRSYVIGIRTDDAVGDALFWDTADPYHYTRITHDEQGPLLIIGGADHKTGHHRDADERFDLLESYASERFDVQTVDYRWSAQLYNPADGLPYVGKLAGTYVATGFSGEGLTCGTLAAQIISEQIQGIAHPCGEILNPGRAKPLASAGGFLSENLGVASHFIRDRLHKPETREISDVPEGEGRICNMDGSKAAVYRAYDGITHILSPVCTHMGCLVDWNDAEKSWDCPCHGGRFDPTGQVLNGPPVRDLEPMDFQEG